MATGRNWTRDELLIALNLYRKLSFGQLHARNPVIVDLAQKLHRTPNSVAMKLCNFASLDPVLQARGIRGLQGASTLDRDVWDEFNKDAEQLVPFSEEALRDLFGASEMEEVEVIKNAGVRVRRFAQPPEGPTEHTVPVKVRRAQQFFRQMILNAFDRRCCVTGIPVGELLVASHILPWSKFPNERLHPQNGLCLSRLHDAAFDNGLIGFDESRRLLLSKQLRSHLPHETLSQNFVAFEGQPFQIPVDAPEPHPEFLRYHREKVFKT